MPLLAESKIWISRTPFISLRYSKVTRSGVVKLDSSGQQIGSPEHDLRRLLKLDGFPEPIALEQVANTILGERDVPWREFQSRRNSGEGRRATYDRGYGFGIEFAEAVRGPIALAYGVHFGMDLNFAAILIFSFFPLSASIFGLAVKRLDAEKRIMAIISSIFLFTALCDAYLILSYV